MFSIRCKYFLVTVRLHRGAKLTQQKHGQCSEPFYRETVLQSIKTDPTAGLEEKKGMMEMLRRFEEEAADGGSEELLRKLREEEGEEVDEDDGLAEKLAGVDLGTSSSPCH